MRTLKKISTYTLATAAFLAGTSFAYADSGVDELNELLRGELSAVETYNQALGKYKSSTSGDLLVSLRSEHEEAVKELQGEVKKLGGTPATSSGPWGSWVQALTGGAKAISEAAALKILKEGEEHGLDEYKELLEDEEVSPEFKTKVREDFIATQNENIKKLDMQITKLP